MGRKRLTPNLTPHRSGRYCKKINGKLHYFGSSGCFEDDARREWIEFLSKQPSSLGPNPNLTVAQLFNEYAATCEARIKDGELQRKTWIEYDAAIALFVEAVGPTRIVRELIRQTHGRGVAAAFLNILRGIGSGPRPDSE